ncbi:MAG: AAA family ATPase [Caldilineaceae bacterium]
MPTEKSRSLLAYLLVQPGPHTRAHLAGVFWPDLPEKNARRRLTQEVWRIGNELEKAGVVDLLETTGATVSLAASAPLDCDLFRLRAALAALRKDDPYAWPAAAEIMDLYLGDLLPGYFDDWVLLAREQLFQSVQTGLAQILAWRKRQNAWTEAEQVVHALLQLDPLAEEWVGEAMQIAATLNRPDAGLRIFERYRERLARELETTPAPALTVLAQQLSARSHREDAAQIAAFADPSYAPPLIGRDGERTLLLHALAQAQSGQGQICLLEGPAGVGKSRLVDTILADARWRGLLVGRGAAHEIELDLPYAPLIQAVGDLLSPLRAQQLRILVDPMWLAVAGRVLATLPEWLPDLPTPPPLDPEPDRVRLLEALTRLVLALGQLTPTVLVLDDVQWADSATLSALIYLSRRVAESPLLLLLSYRSDEARANPAVWVSLSEIDRGSRPQRLQLDGISAPDTADLVRRILGLSRPAPLFEKRIFTQTQGNPFFVLETLRTLYQEGNLTPTDGGGWQTPWDSQTVDYEEAFVSTEVASMIQRRLTHLLPTERQILDIAAVLGTSFDLNLLASLFPGAAHDALTATATLVQRRFLQETATAYRFEHDQIRQTVYAQLPDRERRQLHRRAGDVLARAQPHAAALLAYHFGQAGATGQAVHYHTLAGDSARASGSYLQARRHYEQAAAHLADGVLAPERRFELLLAWESVLDLLGEREAQAQVFAQLAQEDGLSRAQRGVLALRQARLAGASGQLTGALSAVASCCVLAEEMGDLRLQVESLIYWGELRNQVGDLPTAEDKLRHAVTLAAGMDDPRLHAQALIHLADVLPGRNAYDEALAVAQSALTRYQELGDVAGEAHANVTLAVIQVERGDVAGGAERYFQALALTEQCGYRYQEARIATNLANALCILGRIGEALTLYDRGMAIGRQLGEARVEHVIAINHGSTYLSFVGPDDDVIAQVRRALAWSEEVGDPIGVGQAWNLLSMAAFYSGDLVQARQDLDRSVAAFAAVDYAYVKAQALRAQATLSQAEGNFADALRLIEDALAISRDIDAPHLVTEMRSIQGEIFLELGMLDAADAATAEAVDGVDPNVFQSYLLYHRRFRVLRAAGNPDEARAALVQAITEFSAVLDSLSPEQRARSRGMVPAHRLLLADAETVL